MNVLVIGLCLTGSLAAFYVNEAKLKMSLEMLIYFAYFNY